MSAEAEFVVCKDIFTLKEVLLLSWVWCLLLRLLYKERSCGNVLFDEEVGAVVAPTMDDETLRGNEHAASPPSPLPIPSP